MVKGKAIDFTSPRTSYGQTKPNETVAIGFGTISNPSEGGRKPWGENHQALAVKGERHPTCGPESESNLGSSQEWNPGSSQEWNPGSSQEWNPGSSQESNPGSSQESNPSSSQESNPGSSQESNPGSSQESNPGRSGERRTCYHGTTMLMQTQTSSVNTPLDLYLNESRWRSFEQVHLISQNPLLASRKKNWRCHKRCRFVWWVFKARSHGAIFLNATAIFYRMQWVVWMSVRLFVLLQWYLYVRCHIWMGSIPILCVCNLHVSIFA